MLLSLRKNGLTSLNKEVRVFKVLVDFSQVNSAGMCGIFFRTHKKAQQFRATFQSIFRKKCRRSKNIS